MSELTATGNTLNIENNTSLAGLYDLNFAPIGDVETGPIVVKEEKRYFKEKKSFNKSQAETIRKNFKKFGFWKPGIIYSD